MSLFEEKREKEIQMLDRYLTSVDCEITELEKKVSNLQEACENWQREQEKTHARPNGEFENISQLLALNEIDLAKKQREYSRGLRKYYRMVSGKEFSFDDEPNNK